MEVGRRLGCASGLLQPLAPHPHVRSPQVSGLCVQGRGSNAALERGEAESVFREHVVALQEEAVEGFLDLLDAEMKVGWGGEAHVEGPVCRSADFVISKR